MQNDKEFKRMSQFEVKWVNNQLQFERNKMEVAERKVGGLVLQLDALQYNQNNDCSILDVVDRDMPF